MDLEGRLEVSLEHAVKEEGLEFVHAEYYSEASPAVLRVYIDKPGGITHQDCEKASRQIGNCLDGEDMIDSRYVLEVSSPGIERPLFKEVDYQRFVGEEIQLLTTERIDDQKKFKGFIRSFSQGVLILELEDKMCHIPFEKIRKANLAYQP